MAAKGCYVMAAQKANPGGLFEDASTEKSEQ
jgi:hypothetical protein